MAREDKKFVRKQTKKIYKEIWARIGEAAKNRIRRLHFTVYEDFDNPSDIFIAAASKVSNLLNKKEGFSAKLKTDNSHKCWICVWW